MILAVKLSILMPVYNEAATLQSAVKRVLNVDFPVEFELVIVDDGSTDGTRALYGEWRDDPRVLIHEKATQRWQRIGDQEGRRACDR